MCSFQLDKVLMNFPSVFYDIDYIFVRSINNKSRKCHLGRSCVAVSVHEGNELKRWEGEKEQGKKGRRNGRG